MTAGMHRFVILVLIMQLDPVHDPVLVTAKGCHVEEGVRPDQGITGTGIT